jgi:hypothetical protein
MSEWARRRERAIAAKAAKQAAVQDRLAALRDAGQLELELVPPPRATATWARDASGPGLQRPPSAALRTVSEQ